MLILIHDLPVPRSNTQLIFIIRVTYDRRWTSERFLRHWQTQHQDCEFWHRRWAHSEINYYLDIGGDFFFFWIVHFPCRHYLSNSESSRHASRVHLNSVASSDFKFFLRQRGAFLCRTIHWRVEDHVDIPKILPEFGKKWLENLNLNNKSYATTPYTVHKWESEMGKF